MKINVNCPPRGLFIGRETENVARTLAVDFSAWAAEHGHGTLQVLLQRPGDATPYPVTLTVDGTVATWRPSETDLAEAGTGAVQLVYTTAAGVREKTQIIPVMVEPSLGVESDPPEGWTSWLDQLTDLAAETEQHAADAAESAENAAASAAGALQSATDAGSAKDAAVAAAEAAAASASHYPQIVGGVWYVWSPTAGEYISTGIDAQGEDGVSPSVEITAIQGGHRVVITDADGPHTFDVLDGVTPDMSAYRTAADQDEIDDAQDEELNNLKSALNTKAGILRDTVSGSVASFVPDSTVPNLLGLSVALEPIQDLHGYDSPWPAGGGKNLFGGVYGELFAFATPIPSGSVISVSGSVPTSNNTRCNLYNADGVRFQNFGLNDTVGSRKVRAGYTITSDAYAVMFDVAEATDFQIELSSTATSYAPYENNCPISGHDSVTVNANGTTHTISLPETVYGGDIGVVSGDGESKMGIVDMGSLSWSYYAASKFMYCVLPLIKRDSTRVVCSAYPLADNSLSFGIRVVGNVLRIYGTKYTDASTFASDMAGEQLCYELATPTPISTTPTEISTVEGENNVFSPDGDVTVDYAADLKTYIDNKIAAAVAAMS